jgi:hypothetical protein
MNPFPSLILSLAPVSAGGDWTALPAPALCAPPALHGHPSALWDGSHIRPLAARAETRARPAGPRLPLSTVAQMLEEDARAHANPLEFFRGSPLLLARGNAAALERARSLLADLERQTRALEIELKVTLRELASGAPADGQPAAAAALEQSARVYSGEEAFFGARTSESFVESFEVEVASDSGVSRPQVSLLATGTTLHITAARLSQGGSVFLSGLFDQGKLGERTSFDPESNDLGKLDQPRIEVLQCAFAGVVENGKRLELELAPKAGAARWLVGIEARTTPDRADATGDGWRALDLAFLARDTRALPRLGPGALLLGEFSWNEESPASTALPPSALAASLEDGRTGGSGPSGRSPAPMYWTDELLLLPRSDGALAERALALVAGAEALRGRTSTVQLEQGGTKARFPVASGFPARFLCGSERPWLIGYRTELAPQTWMPVPEVASGFDGLCVWLGPRDESASCAAWSVRSAAPRVLTREDARLGRMQTLARELRSTDCRLGLGETPAELFGGADKLSLGLRPR